MEQLEQISLQIAIQNLNVLKLSKMYVFDYYF